MNKAKYSKDGLNDVMRAMGFIFEREPIFHYSHPDGFKFPVGGTWNVYQKIEQTFALKNRQAYVANRTIVEVEGWKENFPDYSVLWQDIQFRIAKHGVIGFQGTFIPVKKEGTNRKIWVSDHEANRFFIEALCLVPSGHTEILSPFHVRFELSAQDIRPYYPDHTTFIESPIIKYTHEEERLTHSKETEGLFEEAIRDWDTRDEIALDANGLRDLFSNTAM